MHAAGNLSHLLTDLAAGGTHDLGEFVRFNKSVPPAATGSNPREIGLRNGRMLTSPETRESSSLRVSVGSTPDIGVPKHIPHNR